jgi:hypothetical protein
MEQKAWIDVKIPRFSYLYGHTIYCGDDIWCETCDNSNLSQASHIADICYISTIPEASSKVVISFFNRGKSIFRGFAFSHFCKK